MVNVKCAILLYMENVSHSCLVTFYYLWCGLFQLQWNSGKWSFVCVLSYQCQIYETSVFLKQQGTFAMNEEKTETF